MSRASYPVPGAPSAPPLPSLRVWGAFKPRSASRPEAPLGLGRWLLVLAAAGLGAALLVASASHPWWSFKLYAPQYPAGLGLQVWLTGVTGDVREIDVLNHYIGMASLSRAAPLERALAGPAVIAIALAAFSSALMPRRWAAWLAAAPILTFPVVFIADSFYWMHRFGHDLDPRAPLKIPTFTPEMFGNGQIGQFMSFAQPQLGFWMAVLAAALTVGAVLLRFGFPTRRRSAPRTAASP